MVCLRINGWSCCKLRTAKLSDGLYPKLCVKLRLGPSPCPRPPPPPPCLHTPAQVVAITLRELGYNREVYAREHELLHTLRTISSAIEPQLDTRLGALATAEAARTAAWLRHLRPLVGPGDMVRVVSALNMQDLPHGHEVVLGGWEDASNTSLALLTALREPCQQYCRAHPGWAPLTHALRGGNGTWTGPGYHGAHVHAAYAPLPGTRFGLVYQVTVEALLADMKRELVRTVEAHNTDPKFAKTSEEMVVANRSAAGPHAHVLSRLRFCAGAHPCPLWTVNHSKGLDRALGGHEGWHETTDYRGRRVLEAYEPIPRLGLALTLKVDWAEVCPHPNAVWLAPGGTAEGRAPWDGASPLAQGPPPPVALSTS